MKQRMKGFAGGMMIAVLLAACQTPHGQGERTRWPAEGDRESAPFPTPSQAPTPDRTPRPVGPGISAPIELEPDNSLPQWPKSAEETSGPAVLALLKQAGEARAEGRPDVAAAHLERATRFESRNGFVWAKLAEVYIDKGEYDQAEAIALRANSLARGNPYIEAANWDVISAARSARGQVQASIEASARAETLRRELPRE
jgi:tetratricopeptide (TPR) repeat protein